MNADLILIAEWAKKWLVAHNHTKTELVTISKKRDVSAFHGNGLYNDGYFLPDLVACPHPPLLFHDKQIPERPQVKVVGLTMCHNLFQCMSQCKSEPCPPAPSSCSATCLGFGDYLQGLHTISARILLPYLDGRQHGCTQST